MIVRAELLQKIDLNMHVTMHFEQVIDSEDEAKDFGETCFQYLNEYIKGFGEASLG